MAVNHVSLEVQKGEIFGFLGSNAAGKSTKVQREDGHIAFGVEEAYRTNPPINRSLIEASLHIVELRECMLSLEDIY
ncbi:MAG: hypothetical protein ACFE89_09310 [Candidatus Hodarchaeota archaeon]